MPMVKEVDVLVRKAVAMLSRSGCFVARCSHNNMTPTLQRCITCVFGIITPCRPYTSTVQLCISLLTHQMAASSSQAALMASSVFMM